MLDNMFEQAQRAFKPINELCLLNGKAMEAVAERQKALFSEMFNESVSFAHALGNQKDLMGVYHTQKSYFDGVQSKCLAASAELYELMATTQGKASEVIRKGAE